MADAIENAEAGDTIKLTADIDLVSDYQQVTKNVTIDLNGYDITTTNNWGIVVATDGVSVSLKGTGTVSAANMSVAAYYGGAVTINDGNYVGTILACAGGEVTINNANVSLTDSHKGKLAVYAQEGGKVIVNGGSFDSTGVAVASCCGSSVVINDGTFTADVAAMTVGCGNSKRKGGDIEVNGGIFDAPTLCKDEADDGEVAKFFTDNRT